MTPTDTAVQASGEDWPELPSSEWADTLETLHLWSQIVGKIRMELSPWLNHSWSVPLYVTSRGLTTSPIPYGGLSFEIDFDLIDHVLPIRTSDGRVRSLSLKPKSVAQFYHELLGTLSDMDINVSIHPMPNEFPEPIPFLADETHGAYDPRHTERLHGALVQSDRSLKAFRARFTGKASPVHLFWGSFDLAVTRFSGREAPEHPGGIPHLPDSITREAYSHEVSSCGFWPGNRDAPDPIFYAYAYPTPERYPEASVRPEAAFWLSELGEFVLPYEAVRTANSPDAAVDAFLESTYTAAADLAEWDRRTLEREVGFRPLPRRSL
jgi:hypothetical protein